MNVAMTCQCDSESVPLSILFAFVGFVVHLLRAYRSQRTIVTRIAARLVLTEYDTISLMRSSV